jgi:hypothetical protein
MLGAVLLAHPHGKKAAWDAPNIVLDGEYGTQAEWYQEHDDPLAPLPPPPYSDSHTKPDTKIVVMVAALRETRLVDSLNTMFSTAKYPDRIHFAVIQQNAAGDVDCVEGLCKKLGTPLTKNGDGNYENTNNCKYFDQIRVIRMKHTDAKGPVFARAKQAELVEPGDDFCMQIDAHTHTVQDWDVKMLGEWGMTKNEYAVLTTYPTNVPDLGKNVNNHWEMPHLCEASFIGEGLVRNGQASAAAGLTRPILGPLWAAGLSFMKCHAERNVPNDPLETGIFMGEEYARAARLYTNGYDFYTPTRPYIGTFYGNEKGNADQAFHATHTETVNAQKRMATLLKWPKSDQSPQALAVLGEKYGLGKRRTLEQYAAASGVDTINQKLSKSCMVKYVPWAEDAKNTVYIEVGTALWHE